MNDDEAEYKFLTSPDAHLNCKVVSTPTGSEIQLFGNRAGLLSLANVLLWLNVNSWRRELLSLAELPFVHVDVALSLCIRITDSNDKTHGTVRRVDKDQSLEWTISDEGLAAAGLLIHRLACNPAHEYDYLLMDKSSEFTVHLRMSDAENWFHNGAPNQI